MTGSIGDKSREVLQELIVACGDAAELFEAFKEPLDGAAFFVEAGMGPASVVARRNDRLRRAVSDLTLDKLTLPEAAKEYRWPTGFAKQCREGSESHPSPFLH